MILAERKVRVDGKVRTEPRFPAGFMDVITIADTNEQFRLLYNVKGRFHVHRISNEEAAVRAMKGKWLVVFVWMNRWRERCDDARRMGKGGGKG